MDAGLSGLGTGQGTEALAREITELAAHLHAGTYRMLALIRAFDLAEGWAGPGLRSCAHWLNWRCGVGLNAAREWVRVAHRLAELPLIADAFREGRVSYSKVRAMTRVATPANEALLLEIALAGTAAHVERLVRGYRQVQRREAVRAANARQVTAYFDDDGTLVLRARLPAEEGAAVLAALEAAQRSAVDEPPPEELPQDVSAETVDSSLPRMRRADALIAVAEGYLAAGAAERARTPRPLLVVHVDAATLADTGPPGRCEVEDGSAIAPDTARRLGCEAGVVRLVEAADGTPLDVGRRTRTVPPALRRALEARDGGCRFPGCTARHRVDAHHIRHWADGGETALGNLVLLCRHHHRAVHEGGYGLARDAHGTLRFTDPAGRVIPPLPPPPPRARFDPARLTAAHAAAGLAIDHRTAEPSWAGERMDYGMAVDGLIACDGRAAADASAV